MGHPGLSLNDFDHQYRMKWEEKTENTNKILCKYIVIT